MKQCLSATGVENYPKTSNSIGNGTVPHSGTDLKLWGLGAKVFLGSLHPKPRIVVS